MDYRTTAVDSGLSGHFQGVCKYYISENTISVALLASLCWLLPLSL